MRRQVLQEAAAAKDEEWEQDLLRRYRRGETQALGELLRHYQRRVFSLIRRLVRRREEAEEIMQEAFLQAFRAAARTPEIRPFRPWLFRVAINVCRNHLRNAARRETPAELDDSTHPIWQQSTPSPEQQALRAVDARQLEAALQRLSADERSLFLLRCHEGLSYDELGVTFAAAPGALRVRHHRIVQRLRALLWGER